ncbi:acyltransferase family protein [Maribacter sp. 2307ULW6-5]|uniref:acyltransferase family protein n=1 Tax=Maribacter sp. 2307ULW6-5 TaxID=3386275 RepID=UPI0039BD7E1C
MKTVVQNKDGNTGRRNGLDLFRLIGAFFIMCIHTDFGNMNGEYVANIRLLARWAVPFYFMATGFFLGAKIVGNTLHFGRIQKNMSTLITILIVSSTVYLPIDVLHGNNVNSIATILTGSYFHLWFIGALLTGYMVVWYLFYVGKAGILPYLSAAIVIFALLTDSYDQLWGLALDFSLFSMLLAIPFMYIGILVSKKDLNGFGTPVLIGSILLGFGLQFVEARFFETRFGYDPYTHQFLIGTLLAAIPLFVWSAKMDLGENVFSTWGQKHSLFIYLYHPIVYEVMRVTVGTAFPDHFGEINRFAPVIGLALTLSFSIVLEKWFPSIFNVLNGKIAVRKQPEHA